MPSTKYVCLPFFLLALLSLCTRVQEAPKPPETPAQIELLETRVGFEANGDSRKEVHARVHINNELGVRQFARLNFDYNRAFQQIEIPLVHITHAAGGTADVLPSAVTDQPNPAVVNFPAYHDVRVKSVRILGLAPNDLLEYRVFTTTSHHPLAPDFWLDHTFDRTGVVTQEIFELDLPTSPKVQIHTNPASPTNSTKKSGEGDSARNLYRWQHSGTIKLPESAEADVTVSTFSWDWLSIRLDEKLTPGARPLEQANSYEESMRELSRRDYLAPEIRAKALELTKTAQTNVKKLEALYDFVSQKISTVDVPLGATGFASRPASQVLASHYATPEDKFVLLASLAAAIKLGAGAALTGHCDVNVLARPTVFTRLLISASDGNSSFWLDPSLEIAPFGMIPPSSGKCVFVLNRSFFVMNSNGHEWQSLDARPPFAATQRVRVDATLSPDGTLTSKVKYTMRGDNELLLRVAFHQSPRDKWKDVAQLLALSDGFRGKVTAAVASDPYATKDPFTVEYEITQPKFVDWSKTPVRIPALLPLLGLPDPPEKPYAGAATKMELGTPLDVQVNATLRLPSGTSAEVPTGTSVDRDYATFSSKYAVQNGTITASRHVNFIQREIPGDRSTDYNAFLHAVQTDQSQLFTLTRTESAASPIQPKP